MIGTIRKLGTAFWSLVVGWYRVDRIRVSPTAGRLLSLKVGDRVVLKGELFKVMQRQIGDAADQVTYLLNHPDGDAVLQITRNGRDFDGKAELRHLDQCDEVAEDELVVL
ncbi:hypothetical protein [Novipirellula caenicola]|uniref:DUF5666 domain-containing protein n=1 Tax=Novipirellula caenicola TaxID=1536901 RepID=A0ABP9VRN1_9BACT